MGCSWGLRLWIFPGLEGSFCPAMRSHLLSLAVCSPTGGGFGILALLTRTFRLGPVVKVKPQPAGKRWFAAPHRPPKRQRGFPGQEIVLPPR